MSRLALTLLALVACTKEAPSALPSTAPSTSPSNGNGPRVATPATAEPSASAAPAMGAQAVNPTTPLVFSVSTLAEARLENTSAQPQYVLHSLRVQASRLRLYSTTGPELPAEDRRDAMKFDTTVHRQDYKELEPGAKLPLFSAKIQGGNGSYDLTWGPFSFGGLKTGEYDAVLEWESHRDDYADEAGTSHRLAGVWQGTIRSQRFKVKVP